ncbi:hypothetical protein H1R20_g400, partial [Candolleomyces eurysporus]
MIVADNGEDQGSTPLDTQAKKTKLNVIIRVPSNVGGKPNVTPPVDDLEAYDASVCWCLTKCSNQTPWGWVIQRKEMLMVTTLSTMTMQAHLAYPTVASVDSQSNEELTPAALRLPSQAEQYIEEDDYDCEDNGNYEKDEEGASDNKDEEAVTSGKHAHQCSDPKLKSKPKKKAEKGFEFRAEVNAQHLIVAASAVTKPNNLKRKTANDVFESSKGSEKNK